MTHSRNHIHQRVEGQELYADDRDHNEWTNLAGKPQHAGLKKELAQWFPKKNAPGAANYKGKGGRK